jgi:hypothetical protein
MMPGSRNTIAWSKLGRLGLAGHAGVVSGVVLAVWVMLAPVAYEISGVRGPLAAAVGAAVCLFGAELALAITSLFRATAVGMVALALGMLARMLLPLLLGAMLHLQMPSLAEAGMIYYVLIFYLATLATETTLSLARIPAVPASRKST